jgi:hypothetical protein
VHLVGFIKRRGYTFLVSYIWATYSTHNLADFNILATDYIRWAVYIKRPNHTCIIHSTYCIWSLSLILRDHLSKNSLAKFHVCTYTLMYIHCKQNYVHILSGFIFKASNGIANWIFRTWHIFNKLLLNISNLVHLLHTFQWTSQRKWAITGCTIWGFKAVEFMVWPSERQYSLPKHP